VAWHVTINEIEVLANGIGGTSIPIKPYPLLRWDDLQEMAQLLIKDIPAVF
jgi:hypothetical protein